MPEAGQFEGLEQFTGGAYGKKYKEECRRYYGSFVHFSGRGEMIPNDDCYCELDPEVKDQWGIPVLRFHWKWSEHEINQAAHMHKTFAQIIDSMEWERSCILGSHVGAMERQLEDAIRYTRERSQFGQRIGKFQSVANRIADMKVRLETARLLLYRVAWLKQMGKPTVMEAALAKLYLSECFVQSSLDAVRTYGGYGYMTEMEVERDLRDAVGGTLYSGTSDIQRMIIARMLGL